MNITNDSKIKRMYESTKQINWRPKIIKLMKNGSGVVKHIYADWDMEELCKDKVYRITKDDMVFVMKKIKPDEDTDLMIDNVCEIVANTILTHERPDLVIPIRNIILMDQRLYMIFNYHTGGTLWDNKELFRDSHLAFMAIKAVYSNIPSTVTAQ